MSVHVMLYAVVSFCLVCTLYYTPCLGDNNSNDSSAAVGSQTDTYDIFRGYTADSVKPDDLLESLTGVPILQACLYKCTERIQCATASYTSSTGICRLYKTLQNRDVIRDDDSDAVIARSYCRKHDCRYIEMRNRINETCMILGTHASCVQGPIYKDCEDAFLSGETDKEKIYNIHPVVTTVYPPSDHSRIHRVRCEFDGSHGWTVLLNRYDGSRNLHYRWSRDQEFGIGHILGEFWAGWVLMRRLATETAKLHIRMETFDGELFYANYSSIRLDTNQYYLSVSGYDGDAGDSLSQLDGNSPHFVSDSEIFDLRQDCPYSYTGGDWWISSCNYTSNLAGKWYPSETVPDGQEPGIYWSTWKNESHSLKAVKMMISRD